MMKKFVAALCFSALILQGGEGAKALLLRYQDTFDGSISLLRYEGRDSFRLDSFGRSGRDAVRMEQGILKVYPSGREGYEVSAEMRKTVEEQVEFLLGHRGQEKQSRIRKVTLPGGRQSGVFVAEWRKTPFGTLPGTFYVRSCGGVTRRFLAEIREAEPVEESRYRPLPVREAKKKIKDEEYLLLTAEHPSLGKKKAAPVKKPAERLLPGGVTAYRPVFLFLEPLGAVYGTESGNRLIPFDRMDSAERSCFGKAPEYSSVPVPSYAKQTFPEMKKDPVLASQEELTDFLEYRLSQSRSAMESARRKLPVPPERVVMKRDRSLFLPLMFPGFLLNRELKPASALSPDPMQQYVAYALAAEDGAMDLELENRILDMLRKEQQEKLEKSKAEKLKKTQIPPEEQRRQNRAQRRKELRDRARSIRERDAAAAKTAEKKSEPAGKHSLWDPRSWF